MTQAPRVTVVIAGYRDGPHFREAVASASAQTFRDLEVLVSDDSPGRVLAPVVQEIAATDPRFRYRANESQLGPAGNHWAAFHEARGEFIAILNHDDRWRPEFLSTLVAALDRDPTVVVAFCDHEVIDHEGRVLEEITRETSRQWGRDRLAAGAHLPFTALVARQSIPLAMGSVFRRSAIDLRDLVADVGPAYDFWLAYLLARGGRGGWYVPERLSEWRIHPSSITSTGDPSWAIGAAGCWATIASDPAFREHRYLARRRACEIYAEASWAALRAGDRALGNRLAIAGWRTLSDARLVTLTALSAAPRPVRDRIVHLGEFARRRWRQWMRRN